MLAKRIRNTHHTVTGPVDLLSRSIVIPPEITLRKICVILRERIVQLFKILQIHPVIRVDKRYIFSRCQFNTEIPACGYTFIFFIDHSDPAVLLRPGMTPGRRSVC